MSSVAERSVGCLISRVAEDSEDHDYCTVTCLCGTELRVLRAEGYERWDEHWKAVLTCGDSRGSLLENVSGPGAVAAARDLDETCKEVAP